MHIPLHFVSELKKPKPQENSVTANKIYKFKLLGSFVLLEKMEDWEESHVMENLSSLIDVTRCNRKLLKLLKSIFSQYDMQTVKSAKTSQEEANALYRLATQKINGYETLVFALHVCEQNEALDILVQGYNLYDKPIPEFLIETENLSLSSSDDETVYIEMGISDDDDTDILRGHEKDKLLSKLQDIVVGDPGFTKLEIASVIYKCTSFSQLHEDWKPVARYLGIADHQIKKLSDEFTRGKTLEEVIYDILSVWKSEKGSQAKILELRRALSENNLNDIADEITEVLASKLGWLDGSQEIKIMWRENEITLAINNLQLNKPTAVFAWMCKELNKYCHPKYSNPVQLLQEELNPIALPKYYISRTLVHKTELNPVIFKTICFEPKQTFLFTGIDKPGLAKLTDYERKIAESWNQWHKLTTRFILLTDDSHYDRICNKWKDKHFHKIHHEAGRYFWIKSNHGLKEIRPYVLKEGNNIFEDDMATRIICFPPPCSIGIADTPGMGKTLLLANLAANVKTNDPTSVILFINLLDFAQQVYQVYSGPSAIKTIAEFINKLSTFCSSVIETATLHSSSDQIIEAVLIEILKNETRPVYMFLDGYDEVTKDKLTLVDSFLKDLQQLKNVKLIVATRPHLTERLESIFHQISYEIQPFHHTDQINFLTKYWINHDHYQSDDTKSLNEFAHKCLQGLSKSLSDNEKEMTGIPLQCMMLAEVYAEDAKSASVLPTFGENVVTPISLFDMYKRLIQMKFSKILDQNSRQNYIAEHIFYAISTVYPRWMEMFTPILPKRDNINENTLYSIGLLELSSVVDTPRFVHRTFAEYLLAEFLVQNLGSQPACRDFFFNEIFGWTGTRTARALDGCLFTYELNYIALAYFVEMHLKEYSERAPVDALVPTNVSKYKKFNAEDVCIAVATCASTNLEHACEYAMKILHQYKVTDELKNKYFIQLPHVVVTCAENVTLLEKVFQFTELKLGVDLSYHATGCFIARYNFDDYTPLHAAVYLGHYNIVTYLIRKYAEEQLKNLMYLLHGCVDESAENDNFVIEQKLIIIDILINVNRSWLEERFFDGSTPLLIPNVHIRLLQHLIKCGADINALDEKGNSLLLRALKYTDSAEFIFKLLEYEIDVNLKNKKRQNAVHKVMAGRLDSSSKLKVLKMFKSKGFNGFDQKDEYGYTSLDVAEKYGIMDDHLLCFLVAEFCKAKMNCKCCTCTTL